MAKGTKVVQLSSFSRRLLEDVSEILEYRFGLVSKVTEVEGSGKSPLGMFYYLNISGDTSKILSTYGRKLRKEGTKKGRVVYDRVEGVVSLENSTVYDISVEGEEAYIANGIYSHNSEESRQVLEEIGINSAYLSVDRNDVQYLEFINLLLDGRLLMSQQTHDLIAEEIFDLIHFRARRKVDHPAGGMKDVMDACVGAVWNALYSEDTSVNTDDVKASAKHTSSREDDEQQRVLESILGDYMKEVRDGER